MPDYRYLLSEREIPKFWYNVIPDLPAPMSPPLHPGTLQPAGPQDLEAIFPHALIEQEMTAAQNIPIPEPVLDILRLWRPTPLHRAHAAGEGAGDTRQDLFQERRSLTRRQPQAQHGHRAGVLQQGRRASNA